MTKETRIGQLPPLYTFILNPYTDARFTRCPGCNRKMRQQAAAIHSHRAGLFAEREPSVIGNDYLVLGTVERQAWRESVKQPKGIQEMLEHLHDFKEVRTVEYQPAGWYPADDGPATPEHRADKPATGKKQTTRRKRGRRRRK